MGMRIDWHRRGQVREHPVRRSALERMQNGEKISPNMLAKELKTPLSNLSYHMRELQKEDAITLVDTEPRRGSVEHFYILNPAICYTDGDEAGESREPGSKA